MKLRRQVRVFAYLMEQQLLKNDHKGGWSNEMTSDLLKRLREEITELEQTDLAIARNRLPRRDHRAEQAQVGREAADVANFAMMIADVCGALTHWGPKKADKPSTAKPEAKP